MRLRLQQSLGILTAALGGLLTFDLRLGGAAVIVLMSGLSIYLARAAALVLLPILMVMPFINYTPVPGVPGFLSLTTLLLAGVIAYQMLNRFLSGKPFPSFNQLDWLLLALLLFHLPAVMLSLDPRVSLRALVELSVGVGLYFFLAQQPHPGATARQWIWGVAFATAMVSLLGVLQFLTDDVGFMGQFMNHTNEAERATFGLGHAAKSVGVFLHANSFSLYLTLAVPLIVGLALEAEKTAHRLALWGVATLGILAELTTMSRAGLMSFAVIGGTFWFAGRLGQRRRSGRQRGFSPWLLLLIAILGAFVAMRIGLFEIVSERFLSSTFEQRDAGSNFTRLVNMGAAINAFLSHPFFGIGPGTSAVHFVQFGGFTDLGPHNLYLYLASERGSFVLLAFLAMVGIAMRMVFQQLRQERSWLLIGFFAALFGILMHGFFESILADIFLPLFFANLAMIQALARDSLGQTR